MLSTARNFNPAPAPCQPQTENPLASLFRTATDAKVSCEARLLYFILTDMAWTKGRCWPSLETQAAYLGRSVDSVARYHAELESAGLLVVERRAWGRGNTYWPAALHGQPLKPQNRSQSHRDTTRMGAGSNLPLSRTGAALTPKRIKELQNVENVLFPPTSEPAPNLETAQNGEQANVKNVIFAPLPENQEPEPAPVEPSTPGLPLVGGPSTNNPQQTLSQSPSQEILSQTPTPENQPTTATCETAPEPKHQPKPTNPAPFDLSLVLEIENLTGDKRSRGAWVQIVRHAHPTTVQVALSATRAKSHEESGVNLGSYFIGVIRNTEPDFYFRKKGKQKQVINQKPAPAKETPMPPTPVVSPLPKQPAPAKPEPCCLTDLDPEEKERRRLLGIRMMGLLQKRLSGEISQAELEALVAAEGGEQKP